MVEDYQKASGNKLDYTIIPFAPMRQKIVSAITSGAVPDLFQNNPTEISALYAWDDKLVDVSDVVDTQRNQFTPASLAAAYSYNNVKKERGCQRPEQFLQLYCRRPMAAAIWLTREAIPI